MHRKVALHTHADRYTGTVQDYWEQLLTNQHEVLHNNEGVQADRLLQMQYVALAPFDFADRVLVTRQEALADLSTEMAQKICAPPRPIYTGARRAKRKGPHRVAT